MANRAGYIQLGRDIGRDDAILSAAATDQRHADVSLRAGWWRAGFPGADPSPSPIIKLRPVTDQIQTNTILNSRYQMQRILGEGGMGAVYLAMDLQHRRPVAIKVARLGGLEARDQFRREAAFLKRLHHHSLPRVWDYFSDTQRDFLVMEYIPGEDLESLVYRQGPQPEWLVLRWADELLDGLEYLHDQDPPLIHRDIKPGNLKLRTDETLVLVDFGIATELHPDKDTDEGALAVTPGFSPPEQYSDQPTDARTDIYSVGATLYFLLTGQTPPAAIDRIEGRAQLDAPSKRVASLSPSTDMLVLKALNLRHGERWAAATDMRHAVAYAAQYLATSTFKKNAANPAIATKSLPTAVTPVTRSIRRTGLAFALVLLAVALAAGAMFALRASEPPPVASQAAGATETDPSPSPTTTAASSAMAAATQSSAASPTAVGDNVVSVSAGVVAGGSLPPDATHSANDAAPSVELTPTSTYIVQVSTSTPTRQATQTPTATRSATTPTTVKTAATPVAVAPTATSPPAAFSVIAGLVSPLPGDAGNGTRLFQWQVQSGGLNAGEAFEVRFWRSGQDPLQSGLGVAGTTRESQMTINLDGAAATLPGQFMPGEYLWGVVLVNQSPYAPIRLISEARSFRFDGSTTEPSGPPPGPTRQPDSKATCYLS